MALEVRPELEAALLRHGLAEDDAVRVADRDEHRLDAAGRRMEVDLVGLAVKHRGQVGGAERRAPDVELGRDLGTVPGQDIYRVGPIGGAQREVLARAVDEDRMRRRDAQAVAALLGLGAVGVEDPNGHGLGVEGEQAIGAEAEVPVAQRRQMGHDLVEGTRQVHEQVVVAQRLVLKEVYLRHRRNCPGIRQADRGLLRIERLMRDLTWPAQRLIHIPACFCS